ncbi:MAG: hypothetical protein QM780_09840 [Hyphomicrobium sp.]|uniref:hypothetical protein n=1 Tax=Hyphomicrobium sp. TaxID=82 RepID=UPI0039E44905
MPKTSLMLAAAAGLAMWVTGVSSASANGMHMHNHFFHHRPALGLIIGSAGYSSGCGYLYDRWLYTGDYYWRFKYRRCLSGW